MQGIQSPERRAEMTNPSLGNLVMVGLERGAFKMSCVDMGLEYRLDSDRCRFSELFHNVESIFDIGPPHMTNEENRAIWPVWYDGTGEYAYIKGSFEHTILPQGLQKFPDSAKQITVTEKVYGNVPDRARRPLRTERFSRSPGTLGVGSREPNSEPARLCLMPVEEFLDSLHVLLETLASDIVARSNYGYCFEQGIPGAGFPRSLLIHYGPCAGVSGN